jgi:hypothetical protein
MVFDKAEANVIHNKIKSYHQMCGGISPNPVIRKRSRPEPGSSQNHHEPIELIACLLGFLRDNEAVLINYC